MTGAVVLALSIFWVVVRTLENSQMAGRNFSCRSQMLGRGSVREHMASGGCRTRARGSLARGAVSTWRGQGGGARDSLNLLAAADMVAGSRPMSRARFPGIAD